MGRALLVARLAVRDLRRRPGEAALLLMALTAATFTLTLGLVLRDLAHAPFERTRAATAGPDVTAQGDLDALAKLTRARGVAAHSGPYPMAQTSLAANGKRSAALAQGRDVARAKVDQPKVTEGSWVRAGGVVVERSFADALGVHAGDALTVSSRRLRVAGVAVTAAVPAYPSVPWIMGPESRGRTMDRGLIWLTRADASALGTPRRVFPYMVNLRLSDPAAARAFVAAHEPPDPSVTGKPPTALLEDWRRVAGEHADLVRSQRRVLLTGSWLLALLALASVSVLVGGRMASQIRRVGLLKAVGGTPVLVAAVLLAQYLALALVAAAAGLGLGRLFAPELGRPTAGLLGSTGPIPFTAGTIGVVTAVAVAVAMVATAIPALRAARTSTVLALADAARAPRRSGWLIALSARLPVPLLLGLRMAARRPRRVVLSAFSVMVAVSGTVAAPVRPRRARLPVRRALGPAHRSVEPGAAAHHRHARRAGRGQRDLRHLGHGPRRAARVGAGARPGRHPGAGERRAVRGAGDPGTRGRPRRRPGRARPLCGGRPGRHDDAAGLEAAGDRGRQRPRHRRPHPDPEPRRCPARGG